MTPEEFRERLRQMDHVKKDEWKRVLGCGGSDDDKCVELFVVDESWEKKFCHALGEQTQADKVAEATFVAARYAKLAFFAAIISIIVTVIGFLRF